MIRKVLLTAVGLAAFGVLVAACDGGGDGGAFALDSGAYDFTTRDIPVDTCWPESATIPPLVGIALPVTIVSTNETNFSFITTGIGATFVPPIVGTRVGNIMTASTPGSGVKLNIGTSGKCSIAITAAASGLLTADSEFDVDIAATLAVAGVTNSAGTAASNCLTAPTTLFGVVPFPVTLRSNGTCNLTLSGDAVLTSN